MDGAPRELELKIELDPSDATQIKRHLSRQSNRPYARQKLVAVYFDTPDLRLHRNGISLRVRRAGGKHTQTVKLAGGPAAGLFDRAEWEQAIGGPVPDLAA